MDDYSIFTEKDLERFWERFDKTDGCWIWKKPPSGEGYCQFYHNYKKYSAHRLSYFLAKGKIPKDYHIDHLCRVRNCVNPDHLEAVTYIENLRRSRRRLL
jgi:hypothetical protein